MDKELKKLMKKVKLNEDEVKNIIVYDHLLNNVYKKSQLKEVNLDINLDSMDYVRKLAKALKVNVDTIICYALYKHTRDNK